MTWTQSNITNGIFNSVYYANNIWVAGSNNGLYYSTDGKTWTQSNITSNTFYSVYYANGIWVAGSYYSESTFSYIVGDNESDYPDKTVQDGYYYEKVLPALITFTINGTSYQAKEGMTWAEWINSEYNTGGYALSNPGETIRLNDGGGVYEVNNAKGTNIIEAGASYTRHLVSVSEKEA